MPWRFARSERRWTRSSSMLSVSVVMAASISSSESGRSTDAGRRLRQQVLVVPGEIALQTVLDVTRLLDRVELVGVDHQLGLAAEAAQGLEELLRVEAGHVDVDGAAEEQGRRGDLLHLEK